MEGATYQECDDLKLQEEHRRQIPQAQSYGLEHSTESQEELLPCRGLGGIPHAATCARGGGPPDRRGQPAAGADPDSITLANGDLEFRWSCDATDVGNT